MAVVRDALQGASLVVYLGHGNGWPSRYRKSPFPKTQNGLGLNPEAGVDDEAHQYFGEAYLARHVRLAPHAVVLLVHLCYASGNSEPGVPEGDLATAQQRVDNFAAGWLATGAEAVIAEGHGGPAYYVRRILSGDGTVEFDLAPGADRAPSRARVPERADAGHDRAAGPDAEVERLLPFAVARAELRADEVARGAALAKPRDGTPVAAAATPVGPTIKDVTIDGVPTVASSIRVTRRSPRPTGRWPAGWASASAGIRSCSTPRLLSPERPAGWRMPKPARRRRTRRRPHLRRRSGTVGHTTGTVGHTPGTVGHAGVRGSRTRPATGDVSPSPEASPATAPASPDTEASEPPAAPPVVLISPEVPGAVVDLADVTVKGSTISAELSTPDVPGLYRLVVTLHGSDGAAFSTETQDRIPGFNVRVTGELSAVVSAADRLSVVAGAGIDLPVTVANTGYLAWVSDQPTRPATGSPSRPERDDLYAALVAQWMRLDASGVALETIAARAAVKPPPGATQDVMLSFSAPAEAGTYLLILDVVSPLYGSLMAVGGSTVVVRVEVTISPDEGESQVAARQTDRVRRPRT